MPSKIVDLGLIKKQLTEELGKFRPAQGGGTDYYVKIDSDKFDFKNEKDKESLWGRERIHPAPTPAAAGPAGPALAGLAAGMAAGILGGAAGGGLGGRGGSRGHAAARVAGLGDRRRPARLDDVHGRTAPRRVGHIRRELGSWAELTRR